MSEKNNNDTKNCFGIYLNKVVVIGLGQLGLPVAKFVKEKGFDTYGYDINEKVYANCRVKLWY